MIGNYITMVLGLTLVLIKSVELVVGIDQIGVKFSLPFECALLTVAIAMKSKCP